MVVIYIKFKRWYEWQNGSVCVETVTVEVELFFVIVAGMVPCFGLKEKIIFVE